MKISVFPPFFRTGLFAAILLLLVAQAAPARSIAKDETNIRSGPNLQSEILFTVPRGYPIEVQERSGEWTRFQDWQGNSAWVYSSLVTDVNTAVILVDKANIRSAGATSAKVAAVAEIGSAIDYLLAQENVSSAQAGVVGFCIGGGLALMTALADAGVGKVGAAVPFYGQPLSPEQAAQVQQQVL